MPRTANELFRRTTDNRIHERLGKRSLDVGADRIARTAHAALRLLDDLRVDTGHAIPLAWDHLDHARVAAIGVYPAATRIVHGMPSGSGSLLGLDSSRCHLTRDWSSESADARDAVMCAVAAMDFLVGRAIPPVDRALAEHEGWIWA